MSGSHQITGRTTDEAFQALHCDFCGREELMFEQTLGFLTLEPLTAGEPAVYQTPSVHHLYTICTAYTVLSPYTSFNS